jgi:hypothetical protein
MRVFVNTGINCFFSVKAGKLLLECSGTNSFSRRSLWHGVLCLVTETCYNTSTSLIDILYVTCRSFV